MFSKVINVGRDAVLRQAGSTSVFNLVGAYSVGFGDKKKTQWIELSCWGKQAETLAQYVVKGAKFCVHADDICIESFTKDDGTVLPKLVGKLVALEFCSSNAQSAKPQEDYRGNTSSNDRYDSKPTNQEQPLFDESDDLPF
jgi:single-strand DNA-binding protein